jgi:hypothetical protein
MGVGRRRGGGHSGAEPRGAPSAWLVGSVSFAGLNVDDPTGTVTAKTLAAVLLIMSAMFLPGVKRGRRLGCTAMGAPFFGLRPS